MRAVCGASPWLKHVKALSIYNIQLSQPFLRLASYTTIWNSLDYTALVIPTGFHVDPVSDMPSVRNQFYNDQDKAIHAMCKKHSRQLPPLLMFWHR